MLCFSQFKRACDKLREFTNGKVDIDHNNCGGARSRAVAYLSSEDFHILCRHSRKPLAWFYRHFLGLRCNNYRTIKMAAHKNRIPLNQMACPKDECDENTVEIRSAMADSEIQAMHLFC